MNAEQKLNELIIEYRSLKTEDEKATFEKNMSRMLADMNPDERKAFRSAFLAAARRSVSEVRVLREEVDLFCS